MNFLVPSPRENDAWLGLLLKSQSAPAMAISVLPAILAAVQALQVPCGSLLRVITRRFFRPEQFELNARAVHFRIFFRLERVTMPSWWCFQKLQPSNCCWAKRRLTLQGSKI